MSVKYYLLILSLSCGFALHAQKITIKRSGLVGEGMAAFVPSRFNPAKAPSLILQQEPSIREALPEDWEIVPEYALTDGKASAAVALSGDICLYGGGEVTGPLLRNGQTIKLWNTDTPAYRKDNGQRLYQTHPWVMGVRKDGTAFGVLFDSPWKSELTTYSDRIEFNTEGALFRTLVIDRKSPQDVLRGLAELTGTMEMPPRWALGYHQCRFSYMTQERVQEIADTFRLKKIPADVIWMDIDYMDGYRVFTFDKKRFSDPKQLTKDLHAKGFHAVCMIDPGVKVDTTYAVYNSGTKKDVWVRDPEGKEYHGKVWPGFCAFPDFTMPRTRAWWAGLYQDFMATGIDGVWNDMNEPAVFDDYLPKEDQLFTMPYNTPHRGGGGLPKGPHLLYHNAFGRLMVQATREGVMAANPDKRPFVLTRANLLGGQRFAATWTGDNLAGESFMEVSVPMSITLGLSGQPFSGPDIGGFLENTSPELWAKWIGFGVFLPFVRGHACDDTNNKEPWAFGKAVEETSRIALERRYRLLPYFYTQFYHAHKTGLPIMRPVFFDDPKDEDLREEDQAFLVGKDLLVVPAFAKEPDLPKGIWEPITLVDGDQTDPHQAKLLVKGGGIVPAGKIIQSTNEDAIDELTLYICLDAKGEARGELYWDAGDGWDFKNNGYCLIRFEAIEKNGVTKIKRMGYQGKYKIEDDVHTVKAVVLKNGHAYTHAIKLKGGSVKTAD